MLAFDPAPAFSSKTLEAPGSFSQKPQPTNHAIVGLVESRSILGELGTATIKACEQSC
jgi:hypothetical protein